MPVLQRAMQNGKETSNNSGAQSWIIDIYCFSTPSERMSGGREFVTAPLHADRFSNLKCEMGFLLNLHFCCGAVHFFYHLFLPQLLISNIYIIFSFLFSKIKPPQILAGLTSRFYILVKKKSNPKISKTVACYKMGHVSYSDVLWVALHSGLLRLLSVEYLIFLPHL